MRYVLALDGGGTKCDAVVTDETGRILGWGRSGPTNPYFSPPETVRASYEAASRQALGELDFTELWVCGPAYLRHLQEVVGAEKTLHLVTCGGEITSAYASALEEHGLVILSGTGSFVFGLTPDGRSRHFGGMGPLIGDYGSAYQVGLRGLRAAFASSWTPARRTCLAETVPQALGAADLQEVFRLAYHVRSIGRVEIAALARVVDEAAEQNDAVARGCIEAAAEELAAVAVDVITELQLERQTFAVIAVGSVAQKSRLYWQHLCARVLAVAPGAQPVIPTVKPVVGNAIVALREMGVTVTPQMLEQMSAAQGEILQRLRIETRDRADDRSSEAGSTAQAAMNSG